MKNKLKQILSDEVLSFDGDVMAYIDNLSLGEQKTGGFAIKDGVATIDVKGMLVPRTEQDYTEYGMTGYNIINDYLMQADNSPYVSQIVLNVDSQGGFVKGLGEVVNTISELKKPITTHVTGKMLSSAYWLGVSTNAIHAERGTLVGSVGTYLTHTDYSEQYAKDGVHIHRFGSGKWKGAFDNRIALSDDEKARLQAMVDESAGEFMSHVAKMRGISFDEIKSWEGDSFNASVALEKNLIDSVGDDMNLSEALAEIEKIKAESKAKDELLAKANAEAQANAEALTAHKAKVRDEKIKEYLNNANDKRFGIVRETIVADAAQYYSASHLSKPITAMTTQTVNLDSIYVSVVPSTQVETPLVQNNPSMNSTFFVKGNDEKVSQTIYTSKTNQLGAVYPTSLTVIIGGVTYHDDNGEIRNNSTTIGNIAYETGVINWYSGYVGRTAQISFIPAGYQTGANHTEVIKVPQVGAGFNYVYTLAHTPLPLSIKVSYQSGGEVYTLTDMGGKLTGHGVGTINDKTLMITTSAIPDSDSLIIISYGTDNGALAVGGMTKRLYASITTDKIPSEVLCDGKALNFEVVDDGIRVYFDKLPQKGAVMTLKQANNHTATDGLGMTVDDKNGTLKMVLDRPIIRGSLVISVMGVVLGDDGRGNVIFLGGYEKLQGTNETGNMTNKTFASVMERTTNHYGEIMGVVDYEARTVIIHKPLQIQSVQTVNQPISGVFRS